MQIELSNRYEHMFNIAAHELAEYTKEKNIQSLILGVSGGVDSAVVAAIGKEACNIAKKNGHNVYLHGESIPSQSNSPDEIERATTVCKYYCHTSYESKGYVDLVTNKIKAILPSFEESQIFEAPLDLKIRIGNIKARVRMIRLFDQARFRKGIVLSTDNYTEFMLGFWTLHGDVGNFGPIQKLWKTEVYGIAEYIATDPVRACANAVPTDGLGITNSDIDQLLPNWSPDMGNHRVAYKTVDDILISHLLNKGEYDKDHPVIKRYEETHFKRNDPVNISRDLML